MTSEVTSDLKFELIGHNSCMFQCLYVETNSDGRAEDVRFRTIPTPTPTDRGYVGGMVAQGVSKDCIFNEDFRNVFKSAVGAVVYELR